MISYKPPKHSVSDPNYLYRYIIDGITHIQLMPNKDKISFTKESLYAIVAELEEWEKHNAAK